MVNLSWNLVCTFIIHCNNDYKVIMVKHEAYLLEANLKSFVPLKYFKNLWFSWPTAMKFFKKCIEFIVKLLSIWYSIFLNWKSKQYDIIYCTVVINVLWLGKLGFCGAAMLLLVQVFGDGFNIGYRTTPRNAS